MSSNLDYLIPELRMHLGDTDSTSYRYMDSWLEVSLVTSIKALQRWWGSKYLIDTTTGIDVYRNPDSFSFEFDEPPVIQQGDERPVILMSAILVKSGQLESNSWVVGSWKDAEIAVSNIEGDRAKQFGMTLDWQELLYYLKPPQKQLFGGERLDALQDDLTVN